MYSRTKRLALGGLTGLFAAVLVAFGGVAPVSAGELWSDNAATSSSPVAADELSADEIDGILYMREEEKLARDVYLTLCEQWGLQVFQNIANSEQAHMDALKTLIDRYGLDDPTVGKEIGEFSDPTLQSLYGELTASGQESLSAALKVGAAIEEIDIMDLEEHIAQTDKADILRVYENLMRGSRNHLRAFVSTFERQEGESYEPQDLDQHSYDEIISASVGRGGNGSGRAGRRVDSWSGQQGQRTGSCGEQPDEGQGARDGSGRSGSNQGGRGGGRRQLRDVVGVHLRVRTRPTIRSGTS
jgi:hypothetical protein